MIFNISKNRNIKKAKINSKAKTINEYSKTKKEYFTSFNIIKGYIQKQNILINEFNDYIIILKCLRFSSLKYIVENMSIFCFKEIEIFVYEKEYYLSAKFNRAAVKGEKIKDYQNVIKELVLRDNEFYFLNLYEVITLLSKKVFRSESHKRYEINNIFKYAKKSKNVIQNLIYAKNVLVQNDYIYFNYKKNNEINIKHQVLGLQMYPSKLYNGFLTEINHLDDVETSTYIKNIDLSRIKENIEKLNQYTIIKDYIENKDKMYNTCFYIHIWGSDDDIVRKKETILKIANKYHVILNEFFMQQRRAYAAFLPLMNNNIKSYRAISDVSGILPFNEDIIDNFNCTMSYGNELISDKPLFFKRRRNGIILSSSKESKRKFIQDERNYVTVDLRKSYKVIDFCVNEEVDDYYKILLSNSNLSFDKFNDLEKYKAFKMYCYLCLGAYKEFSNIEKNDIETLNNLFVKYDEKISEITDYNKIKDMFFNYTEKNYQLLHRKINKQYIAPSETLIKHINIIFKILESLNSETEDYVYIYNIQEIINCLPILLKEIFSRRTNNLYLLSSYNDFLLLNNEYVSKEVFKAPYINIIDVNPNDLMKINNYLNLPNRDLIHLRNQKYIAGMLYTDICEFNYYIEKEEKDEV